MSDLPFLRCENLQKWYGGVHALKDVTLEFGRGAIAVY